MMGHKEAKKGGDEWDCFTNGRRVLKYLGLHGASGRIKRRFNRRVRRAERQDERRMDQ